MVQLTPTKISAGDPVTSDLIAAMIQNINLLAAPTAPTVINIENAGAKTPPAAVSSTIVAIAGSKAIKSAGAGTTTTVSFGKGVEFTSTPNVWVQINTIGQTSPSWANSQVFPQIESVTSTSAVIRFRTATANTTVKYTLFAAGTLVTK
jgi:hypothetical protein